MHSLALRARTAGFSIEHWRVDDGLVSICDERELAKLPEAEHAGVMRLLEDVDQLLAKAAGAEPDKPSM